MVNKFFSGFCCFSFRQLDEFIRADWISKIERKKLSHYQLFEMTAKELGIFNQRILGFSLFSTSITLLHK